MHIHPAQKSRNRGSYSLALSSLFLCWIALRGGSVKAQCFRSGPVERFFEERVGGEVTGASRTSGELIEICSASTGYGQTSDSLFGLAQDIDGDFEITAEVESIDGRGLAGLEARVFRGTGSDPEAPAIRVSFQEDDLGIGFSVISSIRSEKGAAMDPRGVDPVRGLLFPTRIGLERVGNRLTTFYFSQDQRVDHLSVTVEDYSPLDVVSYRVALVHGADLSRVLPPKQGICRFQNVSLFRDPSLDPPRLSKTVGNSPAPVGQPTVLALSGAGLSEVLSVTVAGMEADVIDHTEHTLSVRVPPTGDPIRGDVVVTTTGGTSVIENGFIAMGASFVRCDCNGDGVLGIHDAIRKLLHQLVNGDPCECDESEDCNDDDEITIADPLSALFHLFLANAPPPPPPYPNPGTDSTAPMCGLEDQMPDVTGISATQIA